MSLVVVEVSLVVVEVNLVVVGVFDPLLNSIRRSCVDR
jgi:hypothetical protein